MPAADPLTTPEEATVATPVAPLLHVPPERASPKLNVEPAQNGDDPVIGAGDALTVTVTDVAQPAAVA